MADDPSVRTVYFTVVPLFPSNNGGALCCRNHVRRLARDPNIELLVCMAGPPEHEEANRQAVESLGAEYVFLPFRTDRDPRPSRWRHTGARTPFFVGNVAHDPNLRAIEWLATRLAPELEVVDRDTEIRIIGADPESVPTTGFVRTSATSDTPTTRP